MTRQFVRNWIAAAVLFAVPALCPAADPATKYGVDEVTRPGTETRLEIDLAGQYNPKGLMLTAGGYRRWIQGWDREHNVPSSYLQTGGELGANAAYGQAGVYLEWLPVVFAKLNLRYDLYRFWGMNGSLLSFSSGDAPYGEDVIEARKGTEESGFGHRLMFRPTLMAKAGPVIFRNQTDLAYFRFEGTGPYFYEWEYDTLLKDGDWVFDNKTFLLVPAWQGEGAKTLLAGPSYQYTHSGAAGISRQRLGAAFYWVPENILWSTKRPRVYSQIGYNLQDRNRQGQMFVILGAGFDIDL